MKFPLVLGALGLALGLPAATFAAPPEPPPMPDAQAKADLALLPPTDPVVPGAPQIVAALRGKHPRLLFTKEEIAGLKARVSNDPILQKAYDGTMQWSKIVTIPVNPRPPVVAEDTAALVKSLAQAPAMAYGLNHDAATKQRIIDTLTAMSKEPYWADVKELDSSMGAACNMFMVGLLFDAVHDDLEPALRAQVAASIFTHARRLYYFGHKMMLKYLPAHGDLDAGRIRPSPGQHRRWFRPPPHVAGRYAEGSGGGRRPRHRDLGDG